MAVLVVSSLSRSRLIACTYAIPGYEYLDHCGHTRSPWRAPAPLSSPYETSTSTSSSVCPQVLAALRSNLHEYICMYITSHPHRRALYRSLADACTSYTSCSFADSLAIWGRQDIVRNKSSMHMVLVYIRYHTRYQYSTTTSHRVAAQTSTRTKLLVQASSKTKTAV